MKEVKGGGKTRMKEMKERNDSLERRTNEGDEKREGRPACEKKWGAERRRGAPG